MYPAYEVIKDPAPPMTYDLGRSAVIPALGHRVMIRHCGANLDGRTGTIEGWGDISYYIALVLLDQPYANRRVIALPVTVLDQIS